MKQLFDIIEILIPMLITIESSGNDKAVGSHGERGCLQIKEVIVNDANRIIRTKKLKIKPFTLADRISPSRSRQMIRVVLTHYGMKLRPGQRNLVNLAMIFNMGYDNWRDTNWNYVAKLNKEIKQKGKS